ncbi:MAG: hypothetical protein ABH844_03940 [Candidatus Omnitrophota bacterium]
MEEKGLCGTCSRDKECAFPRKFPIWQCEEFTDYVVKSSNQPVMKPKIKNKL